ncbi:MAG: hypothetical protein HYZ49_15865 [Chloroflexi bacterium]|nr:hypothetical protein [Chloroflexota bacterium]
MFNPTDAQIVYLIFFPRVAPVTGQTQPPPLKKSAPYFLELDTELAELGQSQAEVDGCSISIRRQVIDGLVQAVECVYTLADALAPDGNFRKQTLHNKLREMILREAGYSGSFFEEYMAVCLSAAPPAPGEFVQANRLALATLLRNQSLGESDVDQTLISRAQYSDHDLTIVDWEGALIIASEGDFQSDIELLKIGNYQLLRYRLLDRAIERNLETVRRELASKRRLNFLSDAVLRETLEQRLELMLNFEKTEQLLLLIGDWYSAQLYRLIVDEFYIDDWKTAVRGKLDQLDSITSAVRENFAFSWQRLLDIVQIAGWLILLVGYFVLFFLDVWQKR